MGKVGVLQRIGDSDINESGLPGWVKAVNDDVPRAATVGLVGGPLLDLGPGIELAGGSAQGVPYVVVPLGHQEAADWESLMAPGIEIRVWYGEAQAEAEGSLKIPGLDV
jgi:hypothetical protein